MHVQECMWSCTASIGDLAVLAWVPLHCSLSVVNIRVLQDLHPNSFSMPVHKPSLVYTPTSYFLLFDNGRPILSQETQQTYLPSVATTAVSTLVGRLPSKQILPWVCFLSPRVLFRVLFISLYLLAYSV